jgi:hypothetical protein
MLPKIIQIAVASDGPDETSCLVVLRDDGTVWRRYLGYENEEWVRVTLPPGTSGDTALLKELLRDAAGHMPKPPPPHCSCHISPPCNDCVEWSAVRDINERVKEALG